MSRLVLGSKRYFFSTRHRAATGLHSVNMFHSSVLAAAVLVPALAFSYPIGQVVRVRYEQTAPGLLSNGSVAVQGTSGVSSNTIHAESGIFSMEYYDSVLLKWTDFKAVCVDANEFLFSGEKLYFIQTLPASSASTPVPLVPFAPPLFGTDAATLTRVENMRKLYTVGWADATADSTPGSISTAEKNKSAGFQWAAWNVARDTDATVSSGSVRITGTTSAQTAVKTQANSYLSAMSTLGPPVSLLNLLIWTPVKEIKNAQGAVIGYERVSGQELINPNPTPEPAFVGLLAIGVGGILYVRKRRPAVTSVSASC